MERDITVSSHLSLTLALSSETRSPIWVHLAAPGAGVAASPSSHARDPITCAVARRGRFHSRFHPRFHAWFHPRRGAAGRALPRKGPCDAPFARLTQRMPTQTPRPTTMRPSFAPEDDAGLGFTGGR